MRRFWHPHALRRRIHDRDIVRETVLALINLVELADSGRAALFLLRAAEDLEQLLDPREARSACLVGEKVVNSHFVTPSKKALISSRE